MVTWQNKNQQEQQTTDIALQGSQVLESDTDYKTILLAIFKKIKTELENFGKKVETIFWKVWEENL